MIFFRRWLEAKGALFCVTVSTFFLGVCFQYNWAFTRILGDDIIIRMVLGGSVYRFLSLEPLFQFIRVVLGGSVFMVVGLLFASTILHLINDQADQKAIKKIGLIHLVLFISGFTFFIEQFRYEFIFISLVLLICSYIAVLFQYHKKLATGMAAFFILAAILFVRGNYFKNKILSHKILSKLKLVTLKNCTMKRFGRAHDGGYLLCANLLNSAKAAYSYGIGGRDSWGCDLSTEMGIPIHQYDCFDTRQPKCEGGKFIFHPECIGPKKELISNRAFDTLENQIKESEAGGQFIVVKMDIEGAEWESLLSAPGSVLEKIDQLVVEFHGENNEREFRLLKKLNKYFYAINLHYNNNECGEEYLPLPARVYEVLFVNKRIGVIDHASKKHMRPNPLGAPNNKYLHDCQYLQHSLFY